MAIRKFKMVTVSADFGLSNLQNCKLAISEFPDHGYTRFQFFNKTAEIIVEIQITEIDDSIDVITGMDLSGNGEIRIELYK